MGHCAAAQGKKDEGMNWCRPLRAAVACLGVLVVGSSGKTLAAEATPIAQIEVTATRVPEAADEVPVFISILSDEDLRARAVSDLRGALALIGGVEAPSGGDAGPASAVPSLWGLHEFDAFLLVVDGIPLGGAFNPAVPDLDLTNVEKIEVLRGAAPVVFGATAFVGVIQVIHYPAGRADRLISAGYGEHGSWSASGAVVLPPLGPISQSLSLSGKRDGYSDKREHAGQFHGLYRAGGDIGGGTLRVDLGVDTTRSVPPSPVPRIDGALTTLTPLDANYNPTDARIDETRYHGVVGYEHPTPLGVWATTASLSSARIADVRGFLRTDLVNADTQVQARQIVDDYLDSHINSQLGSGATLTWGADLLYGRGTQTSQNGGYFPDLQGAVPLARAADVHVDEINGVYDRRVFVGEYLQLDWKPGARWDFNGGLRLNETREHKRSAHIDKADETANTFDDRTRNVTCLSGMAGVSFRAWSSGNDEAVLYANYRNAFKPGAIDFGPDNRPDILKPETARSYELGVKGRVAAGRVNYQVGGFWLDFSNLVVTTTDDNGDPILENAGGERLKGIEAEGSWRVADGLTLAAAASWHDARFTHYVATEGGTNVDASGHQLTLSPHVLASLGVIYAPSQGLFGSAMINYAGQRFLDLANTARAAGYATLDANLGYRRGRYALSINAANVGDQRPPVTASEFGDQSFYRLSGRKVFVTITAGL